MGVIINTPQPEYKVITTVPISGTYAQQLALLETAFDTLTPAQKRDCFIFSTTNHVKYLCNDTVNKSFVRVVNTNTQLIAITLRLSGHYMRSITANVGGTITGSDGSSQTSTEEWKLYARG